MRQAGTGPFSAYTWPIISSSNKIQRNSKVIKITVCMHSWSKLWLTKYQATKNPTATFEEPGEKTGDGEQKQGPVHAPCTQHQSESESLSRVRLFATPWTIYSLPGFSVYGLLQARILEWVAFPFSRGSSQPRDQTQVCCIAGEFFTN